MIIYLWITIISPLCYAYDWINSYIHAINYIFSCYLTYTKADHSSRVFCLATTTFKTLLKKTHKQSLGLCSFWHNKRMCIYTYTSEQTFACQFSQTGCDSSSLSFSHPAVYHTLWLPLALAAVSWITIYPVPKIIVANRLPVLVCLSQPHCPSCWW